MTTSKGEKPGLTGPKKELEAMQAVFDALEPLDPEARRRVIEWTTRRFWPQGLY